MTLSTRPSASRLPHRLAVALVCATFPLIWVGGLVTTHKAGMSVPDWPNTYGYNLFLYPWTTWLLGPFDILIEHGHRLLGAFVGMLTIGLLVAVWRHDDRAWMRAAGVFALLLVIAQGVLGGMRVELERQTLARLHGCVGPLFFCTTVALAVFTSRAWRQPTGQPWAGGGAIVRVAAVTLLLAYSQLVLGAHIRHVAPGANVWTFRVYVLFHLLVAGLLCGHVAWLAALVWRRSERAVRLTWPAALLAGLLLAQVALGCTTWVFKYNWPGWIGDPAWARGLLLVAQDYAQAWITTAHVAAGSLILALTLVLLLRTARASGLGWSAVAALEPRLEGAT